MVLANLSVHKAARIRQALAARGCELLVLPPYSPDFTPIEQAFSKLKAILRGLGARTRETLEQAVGVAVEAITRKDALAWFACAGYPLPAPYIESCSNYVFEKGSRSAHEPDHALTPEGLTAGFATTF